MLLTYYEHITIIIDTIMTISVVVAIFSSIHISNTVAMTMILSSLMLL